MIHEILHRPTLLSLRNGTWTSHADYGLGSHCVCAQSATILCPGQLFLHLLSKPGSSLSRQVSSSIRFTTSYLSPHQSFDPTGRQIYRSSSIADAHALHVSFGLLTRVGDLRVGEHKIIILGSWSWFFPKKILGFFEARRSLCRPRLAEAVCSVL